MLPLLLLLASIAQAQNTQVGQSPSAPAPFVQVDNFRDCGLVTKISGSKLTDPGCFQGLKNAYLDEDGSIFRRAGYAVYDSSGACAGLKSVRGLWPFYGRDGSQYLIAFSSGTMFSSKDDNTCTAIPGLSNLSQTATMTCIQGMGYEWCSDGADPVFYTNVSTSVFVPQAPYGKYIGFFRNRIVLAGVPGNLTNLYLSAELDGTNWNLPTTTQLTTSPTVINISGTNDGQGASCLLGQFQNQYYVGRQYDLYALSGYNNADFTLRKVSEQIGCSDNGSAREVNNVLMWLSHRGLEGLSGTQIQWLSEPIDPQVQDIVKTGPNLQGFTVNSANFAQGNLTASGAGAPISASIYPGNLTVSSANYNTSSFVPGPQGGIATFFSNADVVNGSFTQIPLSTYPVNNNVGVGYYTYPPVGGYWGTEGKSFAYTTINNTGFENPVSSPTFQGWHFVNIATACFSQTQNPAEVLFGTASLKMTNISGAGCATAGASNWTGPFSMRIIDTANYNPATVLDTNVISSAAVSCPPNNPFQTVFWSTAPLYTGANVVATSTQVAMEYVASNLAAWIYSDSFANPFSTVTMAMGWSQASATYGIAGPCSSGLTSGLVPTPMFDNPQPSYPAQSSVFYPSQNGPGFTIIGGSGGNSFVNAFSTPTYGVLQATITSVGVGGSTITFYGYNASGQGVIAVSPGQQIKNTPVLSGTNGAGGGVFLAATFSNPNSANPPPSFSDFGLSEGTTAYYISPCITAPGNYAWQSVVSDAVSGGGSFSFWMSTSSVSCAAVTSPTANWIPVTANSIPSIPVSSYTAVRVLFNITVAPPTQIPVLNDIFVGWQVGPARPPVASAAYNNRYYLFYTTATAAGAYNDHALIYDQNGKWVPFDDVHAAASALYLNNLYVGDSTSTGNVYQFDTGQDDNGQAYTFSFTTPDLDGNDALSLKEFQSLYLSLGGPNSATQASSLACSYAIDGATTTYSLGAVNLAEAPAQGGYFIAKLPFPLTSGQAPTGHWVNISCSNSGSAGPLRVFGLRLVYTPEAWQ